MENSVGYSILILCLTAGALFADIEDHGEEKIRLDPFHEIMEHAHIPGDVLPEANLDTFIIRLLTNINCEEENHGNDTEEDHECQQPLCVNTTRLIDAVTETPAVGVTEKQFGDACLLLLHHILHLDDFCHKHIGYSLPLHNVTEMLMPKFGDGTIITESKTDGLLDSLEDEMSHAGHEHDEEGEGSEEEEDEHGDHRRRRRRRRDADDQPDEDDHDDDHATLNLIVEPKCLSADVIWFYLGEDTEDNLGGDRLQEVASLVVYLLSEGSHIEETCRIVPRKDAFVRNLFGEASNMTVQGLKGLMTKLKINPETSSTGQDDDHSGHNHRRRRSTGLGSWTDLTSVASSSSHRRQRREASTVDPAFSSCYSADQLVALYGSSKELTPASFQQLCPALVSQALYGQCEEVHHKKHDTSDAEKYGYGTLAVVVVCLCAVLGIVFIPCASSSLHDAILSLFMGLSVGTLFADAILHLIPLAWGIHIHEDGHGSEIVIEKFTLYGLAIMGGLYVFYVLEVVMSFFGGHSHDHEGGEVFTNQAYLDDEKVHELDVVNKTSNGAVPSTKRPKRKGLPPVVVMVILGDALHNFADGLTIGAGFAESNSTGLAITIAVFCHELPHELGDFAVLIKSGMSYSRAILLNLLSAMTALVGLYVGLAVSTDPEVQQWIFAVAAGMFLYIALVDVLPNLTKSKSCMSVFLNNIGILLGFGIMFLVAVFEEHIKI